jgi:uncharacterized membrane protein YhaH (DUF805 family)
MDIGEVLFAYRGRAGRVPFVLTTLSCWIMLFASRYDLRFVHFLAGLSQPALLGSMAMVAWIALLALLGDPLDTSAPLLMGMAAVSIFAQLWLCIEPGTRRANRFGNAAPLGG